MTIRPADTRDQQRLADLASLDSAQPLHGQALLAEVGGAPVAAVELQTGRSVADPFRPTQSIVDLLHLRAAQLR
jgi:hypothetical protein